MRSFWKEFAVKFVFSILMVMGALMFAFGALSLFNHGFRQENPGGTIFFILGLVLLFGGWLAMRLIFGKGRKIDRG